MVKRIMIIDDNSLNIKIFKHVMKAWLRRFSIVVDQLEEIHSKGFLVKNITVSFYFLLDARTVLSNYNIGEFDLVITDLQMPYIGGLELISIMSPLSNNLKFVILSANINDLEMFNDNNERIIAKFTKPFDPNNIYRFLDEFLLPNEMI